MPDLNQLISFAKTAGQVVDTMTGTHYAGAAINAATAVGTLLTEAKATFSETDQAKLEEAREELETRVNAHADSTISSLGDQ